MTDDNDSLDAWLLEVLAGRIPLALAPDEPPHLAFIRRPGADRPPWRRLPAACSRLLARHATDDAVPDDTILGLICIAADLDLGGTVGPHMVAAALSDGISRDRRRILLHGLNVLGVAQPPEFWRAVLAMDLDHTVVVPALRGLLATSWCDAVALLPSLPDSASVTSAAVSVLDHYLDGLEPQARAACVQGMRALLPRCSPILATMLEDIT